MKKYILISFLFIILNIFALGCKEAQETTNNTTNENNQTDTQSQKTDKAPQNGIIYLIALEDQGQKGEPIGCGDSLIPFNVLLPQADNPVIKIKLVLDRLFATKDANGLYNALANSKLSLESVNINTNKITVNLTGETSLNGVCDEPRFKGQIIKTVMETNPDIKEVEIFINGKPIDTVISGQ